MERLLPANTVLLVVDVQEKLGAAMPDAAIADLVKNTGILLETAEALGVRVVASEQYPKGLGRTMPAIASQLGAMGVTAMPKMAFDACSELTIARALADSGARNVVVVGMEAHVCVFQTARELVKRGYATYVVADAVASHRAAKRTVASGSRCANGPARSSRPPRRSPLTCSSTRAPARSRPSRSSCVDRLTCCRTSSTECQRP
jgi:nicotinamidase-related amidase